MKLFWSKSNSVWFKSVRFIYKPLEGEQFFEIELNFSLGAHGGLRKSQTNVLVPLTLNPFKSKRDRVELWKATTR